jgi:hypothetical protein
VRQDGCDQLAQVSFVADLRQTDLNGDHLDSSQRHQSRRLLDDVIDIDLVDMIVDSPIVIGSVG